MFDELLKSMASDKELLGLQIDAYLDSLVKVTTIMSNLNNIDGSLSEEIANKFDPMLKTITAEIDKVIVEYQRKHGEI